MEKEEYLRRLDEFEREVYAMYGGNEAMARKIDETRASILRDPKNFIKTSLSETYGQLSEMYANLDPDNEEVINQLGELEKTLIEMNQLLLK